MIDKFGVYLFIAPIAMLLILKAYPEFWAVVFALFVGIGGAMIAYDHKKRAEEDDSQ